MDPVFFHFSCFFIRTRGPSNVKSKCYATLRMNLAKAFFFTYINCQQCFATLGAVELLNIFMQFAICRLQCYWGIFHPSLKWGNLFIHMETIPSQNLSLVVMVMGVINILTDVRTPGARTLSIWFDPGCYINTHIHGVISILWVTWPHLDSHSLSSHLIS